VNLNKVSERITTELSKLDSLVPPNQVAVKAGTVPVNFKTPLPQVPPLPAVLARSMAALIAAAGLPVGGLSASIVSSTRFFSLPLKPDLMADIRRRVLAAANGVYLSEKGQAALSLAAAAARSKDVELSPEALKNYADALDPDRREQTGKDSAGERHSGKRQKEQGKIHGKSGPVKIIVGSAQNTLHDLMNRLPGRDGKRWMIIPFSFDKDGREYRVSLGVLLDKTATLRGHASLDIAEYGLEGEPAHRWFFVLEHANSGITRLDAYLQPGLPADRAKIFARKLASLMEIPEDCVSTGNYGGPFPWMPILNSDLLHIVDETV
jgi:hypothetical protein